VLQLKDLRKRPAGRALPDQGIELHAPIGFGDQLNHHDFLERAMGIEQIRMNQTKALPPAFQFNWSQMESMVLNLLIPALRRESQ
jgi:hypothetical protein